MADNCAEDSVVSINNYTYDHITAKEALEQLNARIADFVKQKKTTKVQENILKMMKKNLLNKIRKNEPYLYLKKLKAFQWKRVISKEEVDREIDLALDITDMNYLYAQNDLKRPYSKREATEMMKIQYDQTKERSELLAANLETVSLQCC